MKKKSKIGTSDYISVYLRNSENGPSCYYRVRQYLDEINYTFQINNAFSDNEYYLNMKIRSGIRKKFIQAYLYIVACIRRTNSIMYDYFHKPKVIIVQREVFPRALPVFLFPLLKKILEDAYLIWDFDDDIFLSGEISQREQCLLLEKANRIVATSDYLLDMVKQNTSANLLQMATTDGFVTKYNFDDFTKTRDLSYDSRIDIVWVGTDSNLHNVERITELIEEFSQRINKEVRLIVVCNKPLDVNENEYTYKIININWSRKDAENAILCSHIGIMPLIDNQFAKGKGGFKLIQYMSAGLPVVASNVGFNSTVVDEQCGKLIDDECEWIEELYKLATDRKYWISKSRMSKMKYEKQFKYENNLEMWKKMLGENVKCIS